MLRFTWFNHELNLINKFVGYTQAGQKINKSINYPIIKTSMMQRTDFQPPSFYDEMFKKEINNYYSNFLAALFVQRLFCCSG